MEESRGDGSMGAMEGELKKDEMMKGQIENE